MIEIIDKDCWLCKDCTFASVYGDFSSLDNLPEEEADLREHDIKLAMRNLAERDLEFIPGDEEEIEFSRVYCDLCNTHLAGRRVNFIFVKHINEDEVENEKKEKENK